MSRVLLVDDSPHAQRMGERILQEDGHEVVTVTDGLTALSRLEDVDPDLVITDIILPRRSGYQICQFVKTHPRHQHVRVLLTAGLLEAVDDAEAKRAGSDGLLRKPFESSVVLEMARPLLSAAQQDRAQGQAAPTAAAPVRVKPVPVNEELVRAAVVVALDASLPALIDEITNRILIALGQKSA